MNGHSYALQENMGKRKNKRGWLVDAPDDLYEEVSEMSAEEGWKISTFLRDILQRLVRGDELAKAMLQEHRASEIEKKRKKRGGEDDE